MPARGGGVMGYQPATLWPLIFALTTIFALFILLFYIGRDIQPDNFFTRIDDLERRVAALEKKGGER